MDCVLTNRTAKLFPQRTVIRLCGIGRAHQVAPRLDRTLFFERHDHTWTTGHKLRQACEKRALAMNSVESFRLALGHVNEFQTTDLKSVIENALNDRSCMTGAHRVGFDDAEC